MLTSNGTYHSAGNDMANFGRSPTAALAEAFAARMTRMVTSLVCFPKPLVAQVRGPAIGVSVTMLGLFDFVHAAHGATFATPPAALGLNPVVRHRACGVACRGLPWLLFFNLRRGHSSTVLHLLFFYRVYFCSCIGCIAHYPLCSQGCASYTFPLIMGPAMASEMLVLGRKFSAVEARQSRLVRRFSPSKWPDVAAPPLDTLLLVFCVTAFTIFITIITRHGDNEMESSLVCLFCILSV